MLNGTSDWYLRGHGFKYSSEGRQPSVLVRNAAMAPKISRRLSHYLQRERWKLISKHLKEHMCFKRLNNRFISDAGVMYFCAAVY